MKNNDYQKTNGKTPIKLITNLFILNQLKGCLHSVSAFWRLCSFSCFWWVHCISAIMRNQVYDSMKETMQLYNDQISQDLLEALTYLFENRIQ